MDTPTGVLIAVIASAVGATGGFLVARNLLRARFRNDQVRLDEDLARARSEASSLLEQARRDAERLEKESELRGKDELFRKREEFNREMEVGRNELREQERRLEKREDLVEQKHQAQLKKERLLDHQMKKLNERKEQFERKQKELEEALTKQTLRLHEIAGLSREEAVKLLMERLERELSEEIAKRIQRRDEIIKNQSEERARAVLAMAVQRFAAQHTTGTTVSTVDIPSDDMKGRIIGREGRNIRTFEKCTGVDVIVDDTPGVVIVSAFDSIRREVARIALTKLIQDGRIHPTRIEEVVTETQAEMEKHIMDVGNNAVLEANVGPVHEKLVQLLGRLKFRTSYSQNVLMHSLEVAHLCGMMADEIGLDGRLARRCALLHDIGKAADHEMEGGHPKIGAELAQRYGETSKEVLHAIAGHHDEVTVDHVYTVLVAAADAISASRPGARRETLEKYIRRMAELEAVALGFPGIEAAYAIQAGRELRVIANSAQTSDAEALRICREIAKSIEQQLDYPGEIKVTVVREMRAVEFAR